MTRYFFDVLGRSRSEYDFRGSLFADPKQAHGWAELLALDLQVDTGKQELIGGRVGVRVTDGRELFSIPIRDLEGAEV